MVASVLCVNSGSATLKLAVFAIPESAGAPLVRQLDGLAERRGRKWHCRLTVAGSVQQTTGELADQGDWQPTVLREVLPALCRLVPDIEVRAVIHRVVHGGDHHVPALPVTAELLAELESRIPLAPLHQPHNLAGIRAAAEVFPEVLQVAAFDTAFHARQTPVARNFAIPRELTEQGIRRYGFHGLSYAYVSERMCQYFGDRADGRVIIAHLGSGASLCGLRNGRSVATTMGFTALDGLMMGTRCGAIDPGVLLYMQTTLGYSPAEVNDLLYRRSGLLGVSGISSDMRELLASPDRRAVEAVEMFCYRIVREIGSLAAALGGLDAVVFTGGIGEHSPEVRSRVLDALGWLGVVYSVDGNQQHLPRFDHPRSAIAVGVIPCNEEAYLAQLALACI